MRPNKLLAFAIALFATVAAFIAPVHAATRFWTGNNSNSDWNDAGNWNGTLLTSDYAYISSAYYGTNPTPVISSGAVTIARLGVGTDNGEGYFRINGSGTFLTTNAVYIGRSSGGGTIGLKGFVYVSGSGYWISTGGDIQVGEGVAGSLGVLDVSQSGSLSIDRALFLGHAVASSATLSVSDNAFISVGRNLHIGRSGTASMIMGDNALVTTSSMIYVGDESGSRGTLIMQDDALLTTAAGVGITIGAKAGSVGLVQLKGGVVTTGSFTIGLGTGSLDLNGGTVRAAAAHSNFFTNLGNLAINGTDVAAGKSAFAFDTNGNNVTITNTLTYTGATDTIAFEKLGSGTLTLSAAATYAGATRIAAGTLKAGVANLIANSSAVEIASGATFDANTRNQTLQNLSGAGCVAASGVALTLSISADSIFSGTLAGMAALTKTGAGALTLSTDHSGYAATTSVNAGTLILNGANAKLGGPVTLAANTGNLGGNGVFAAVNAAGGNIITIGATHESASAETLIITGALTLANNTILRYDLFDGSNDELSVGTLTRSGTSFIDLNAGLTGSFKLLTATGGALATTATNNLVATINSNQLSGRTSASFSIIDGNELWMDIISSNMAGNKWSGTNTGSWMDSFANWQADDQLFLGGDGVVFDDSAAGTRTVSVDANVRASDMTVNTDTGYTFTGDYAITTSTNAPAVAASEGKLVKNGAGTLILANSGSNYFQNGIVLSGGTLQGNARTLGNAAILNTAALVFDQAGAADYTAAITGGGSLAKINTGTLTLTNAANSYAGGINVAGGVLELRNSGITTQGALNIAADSALRITNGASYTVQNALTGAGTLYISLDASTSAVNFTAGAGTAYAGTVSLGRGAFDLSGQNSAALANAAILELAAGNITTVGNGTQNIRNLSLTGGKLIFSVTIPPDTAAAGIISTSTLALGSGTVQISLPADGSVQVPDSNLLNQDDGTAVTRLINAATVDGNTSGLALVDQNGNPISAATASTADITQGGNTVATGTYNYGFVTNGGLGVNYRLVSLTILDDQTLTLAPDSGATGAGAIFSSVISGSGNLAINAANAPVTLDMANDYTGATSLTAGKLILGANNALGQTSALDLAVGTEADLNGHTQAVGALTTAAGSTLNLAGGSLNLSTGGVVNGALVGAGTLNIVGGTLIINGVNAGLSASATIANNAAVSLNSVSGLGTGVITFGGAGSVLSLDIAGADTMLNNLVSATSGAGQLIKAGSGTITFTGDNTGFSGEVAIESGRIIVTGSSNVITTAKTITLGDGAMLEYNSGGAAPVTLARPIVSTGTTGGLVISDNTSIVLTQSNSLPSVSVSNGSKLYIASSPANPFGSATVVSVDATSGLVNRQATLAIPSLALDGTLWLSDPATVGAGGHGKVTIGQKLTTTGTGTLVFRTDLSRGLGDHLTIAAASDAPSNYKIIVNNTDTPDYWGVERLDIISSNDPRARFTLGNEIATNTGYTYGLRQEGSSHYLYATNSISHEADAILNTVAVMSTDWHYEMDSLSGRMGDVRRELKALGELRPGGNVWARGNAYHINADAEIGGYSFKQDAYGITVGGDKAFRFGNAHLLVGVFAGFSAIERDFHNRGDGTTDSLSGGVYITWLHGTGWYVDATVKMNKYDNDLTARDIDGSVLSTASYDNKATGGSIEIGRLIQGAGGWWVELSAQAAYVEIGGERFTTSTGTPAVIYDSDATQFRGSVRWGKLIKERLSLWMKGALVGTNNEDGEVRFYGSDKKLRADIDGLRMEAGLGLSYAITKRSQLYFDYEYAKADYYTRPWSFNAGYRVLW